MKKTICSFELFLQGLGNLKLRISSPLRTPRRGSSRQDQRNCPFDSQMSVLLCGPSSSPHCSLQILLALLPSDVYAALCLADSCIGLGFLTNGGTCMAGNDRCISCTGVRNIDYNGHASQSPHIFTWMFSNCYIQDKWSMCIPMCFIQKQRFVILSRSL